MADVTETSVAPDRTSPARTAIQVVVVLAAIAAPLLVSWLGIRTLALHLESLQPDGDLEAGGGFAIAVQAVVLAVLAYLGSGLAALGVVAWRGWRPGQLLAATVATSAVITVPVIALSWS
jgi:hypothetical protein